MTSGSNIDSQFADDFSLRKVAFLLGDYTPPPVSRFDPSGGWQQSYAMFVLQHEMGIKVGEFSLERAVKGGQSFALTVQARRFGNSGFSLFQQAEIRCRTDTLATPVSWVFDTKMARDAGDQPYLGSGRRRSAAVANGALAVRDNWRTCKSLIDGPYSNEWTLLEAVQRLTGERTKNLDYTLIDEYDTPQPGHRLAYRTQAQVTLQNGPAQLTGYYDLGPAVVPTLYWVDEHRRLLFVCTGLVIYALTATNGQAGQCPQKYRSYQPQDYPYLCTGFIPCQ